ncbi:hypothetical protein [Bacillus vallismortis]|uniref:hypothetical protein n=1 Tax=Bacillus vallismortis TaxID=72361 RepID=UPI0020915DED|nr:hypothetical protein [Bacillus vallismortis]MCO4850563.1 hypothetical protein [Bacillus vallismortis]
MKSTTTYAVIWISTALAASVGIIVTKSALPLWALFIPMIIPFPKDKNKYKPAHSSKHYDEFT